MRMGNDCDTALTKRSKRQLSKSFTVVIQRLPTRLIKNNFYMILLKPVKASKVFGYGSSIPQPAADLVGIDLTQSSDTSRNQS